MSGPQAASASKYMSQIGWKPTLVNYSNAASRLAFTDLAGSAAVGALAVQWLKDPKDPEWAHEQWMIDYRSAVKTYGKGANADDLSVLNGYAFAEALVNVLATMENPTRDGLLKAWDSVHAMPLDALMPGAQLNGGPDGRLVHSYRVGRFDGTSWVPEGATIDAFASGLLPSK
jgi:branched-chain amino acid transport system substrate-binding protein